MPHVATPCSLAPTCTHTRIAHTAKVSLTSCIVERVIELERSVCAKRDTDILSRVLRCCVWVWESTTREMQYHIDFGFYQKTAQHLHATQVRCKMSTRGESVIYRRLQCESYRCRQADSLSEKYVQNSCPAHECTSCCCVCERALSTLSILPLHDDAHKVRHWKQPAKRNYLALLISQRTFPTNCCHHL